MKYALTAAFGLMLTMTAQAQKFGFVNSGSILEGMPQVKEAESNLEALGKQLQAKGEKMMQDFSSSIIAYENALKNKNYAPRVILPLVELYTNYNNFEKHYQYYHRCFFCS